DSEGVEGKYYVWSYDELKNLLQNDLSLLEKKYEISNTGNFEGKNILIESKKEITEEEENKITEIEKKLILERQKRIKPFFDNK
ncbi:MAG: thioredoxin domain-containing protein, partial [Candidatus Nitrosopelagicus sp.]|nr:thioredoxin domain-containing protein [Candidatus Nitrosopelagicus sp.]